MPERTKSDIRKYNKQYYAKKNEDKPDCYVCGKKFTPVKYTDENGIQVVEMMIGHAVCSALHKKQKKLKEDLLDIEYQLFRKSMRD
jgi:hypothetical protein